MKKLAFAALASGLLMGTAHAADLIVSDPVVDVAAAAHDWNGFYAGVLGGYGAGTVSYGAVAPLTATNVSAAGWLLGGTIGYNHQWDQIVLGVEGDIAWANIAGNAATNLPGITISSNLNWVGTLRGRLGVAYDPFLLYVTAGVAAAGVTTTPAGNPALTSFSGTHTGWTVGAGAEAMVTDDISLKAEYAYTSVGANIPAGAAFAGSPASTSNVAFHAVKIGANFHF